tara:strand:- start:494 stop:679 length:186 start_codon:yes stop_codon:yes gene_type:complete
MKKQIDKINSSPSCMYFLGLIGSATFFISKSVGFWMGFLGFLKAIVWPAFLAYELFSYLNV